MSNKAGIRPLTEGLTKLDKKDLNPMNMGPAPRPIKPVPARDSKELTEQSNIKP